MGEEPASEFSRLHDAYRGRVMAYAAKLVGPVEAEDVAQEVFFKVSQSLATLADRSRLVSWIFAITLNVVRDLGRRRASRVPCGGVAAADGPSAELVSRVPDSVARSPEETVVRREMVDCFLDYVGQLPPDQYEVYVLSEFAELSNPEIARRLSAPVSTVKIRLHRARARLHGALRRDCQHYYNERGELMAEPRTGHRPKARAK